MNTPATPTVTAKLDELIGWLFEKAGILDQWAQESVSGGWSTHQVNAQCQEANRFRVKAAELHQIVRVLRQAPSPADLAVAVDGLLGACETMLQSIDGSHAQVATAAGIMRAAVDRARVLKGGAT